MPRRKSDLSRKSRASRRAQKRRLTQTEEERQKRLVAARVCISAARARESSTERSRRRAYQKMRTTQKRKSKGMTTKHKVKNLSTPSTNSKLPKPFEINLQPHFDTRAVKLEQTDIIKQEVEGEDYYPYFQSYVDPLYVKTEDLGFIPEDPLSTPTVLCNGHTTFGSSESNIAVFIKTEEDDCEKQYAKDQTSLSPIES